MHAWRRTCRSDRRSKTPSGRNRTERDSGAAARDQLETNLEMPLIALQILRTTFTVEEALSGVWASNEAAVSQACSLAAAARRYPQRSAKQSVNVKAEMMVLHWISLQRAFEQRDSDYCWQAPQKVILFRLERSLISMTAALSHRSRYAVRASRVFPFRQIGPARSNLPRPENGPLPSWPTAPSLHRA